MNLPAKLRPQKLEDLIGQDHLIEPLQKSLESQRTSAYLLVGGSGTGKTTIARIIAKHHCNANDITEIDAASNSGVDHARELVQQASYMPLSGGKQAFIVDESHRLSRQTWDVMLKPIEEPGDHLVWIFCTTELSKVPVAIKNRCEQYNTKPVDDEVLEQYMRKVAKPNGIKLMKGVAELIAVNAQGSPRQAIQWLAMTDGMNRTKAAQLIEKDMASEPVIAFCRALAQGITWKAACQHIKSIEEEPESVRHQVLGYFEKVALNAKSEGDAQTALAIIDAFSEPYPAGKRAWPLLRSIGELFSG